MSGGPVATAPRSRIGIPRIVRCAVSVFDRIPPSAVLLLARLSIAGVFWSSGRTKVMPGTLLTLADSTVQLFRDEYGISLPTPGIAAELTMLSEHLFPVLLVVGLASRFAALALFIMTLVIEVFVYPGAYDVHGPWAVCLLLIMMKGPGVVSLDFRIGRAFPERSMAQAPLAPAP
ncbi:MAG TPA: DoxX family protein [Lichenihabitans sp.]|jgi:putative oxidoreductase|nr:DoxX family protein [Lichenihabitans sp.]